MKNVLFLTMIAWTVGVAVFSGACAVQTVESQKMAQAGDAAPPTNDAAKSPVLIELFTSEGCSSCPPADKVLAFLQKEQPVMQADVIALSLHVDYWDNLGWKDEFSSPLYTQRQTVYAQKLKLDTTYTPQMIVDGRAQFVGSDSNKAVNAIMEASKNPKANVRLTGDETLIKIAVTAIPAHENATVYVALAEDGLTSNVKRGENSGQKLSHAAVVRELKTLGAIDAKTGEFTGEASFQTDKKWKRENLKLVAFVQENETRKIIGAAQLEL